MDPWDPAHLNFDPIEFNGVARLFPLPGLVAFPHTVQQLHVFEPRYRAMTEDALAGDGLIALALLRPGWESDVAGRPPLAKHACLGKIIAHHRLDDGRYNLLLLGIQRVRIMQEIEPPIAFRRAKVELVHETPGQLTSEQEVDLARQLSAAMRATLAGGPAAQQIAELLDRKPPLSVLTDLAGYTLAVEEDLKRELLADPCAATRAEKLLAAVTPADDAPVDDPKPFPPPFSLN